MIKGEVYTCLTAGYTISIDRFYMRLILSEVDGLYGLWRNQYHPVPEKPVLPQSHYLSALIPEKCPSGGLSPKRTECKKSN